MEENSPSAVVEPRNLSEIIQVALKELRDTFVAFAKAPRALWGVNLPYVLEGLVYFGILTILGKFCSENVGLSDPQAGWVYGGVTGGITFAMLLLGGVTDKIGVRYSLALALGTMTIGRIMVAVSGTIPLGNGIGSPMFFLMSAGLLLMVAAYGLYQPAAYAGIKRFTNPKTAAMGYAVVYGLMNLGAFFSGFVSSNTRHVTESIFPPNGLTGVFWVYSGITFFSVVITLIMLSKRADQRAVKRVADETTAMRTPEENKKAEDEKKSARSSEKIKIDNKRLFWMLAVIAVLILGLIWLAIRENKDNESLLIAGIIFVALLGFLAGWEFLRRRPEHPFRNSRFVFFIFILIPVQTLFAHNWLTLPYYLDRAFAGTVVSKYFEVFSNLNPILIFIFAPIIAALTAKSDVYKMMIYGTFVMALPTFFLAFGPSVYLFLIYVFFMTIGEAMWQPRFLQWIAEIAPEGKTGAYMGIGQFPWFLTKMITAAYSGYFVAHYIPKPASGLQMHTGKMWFIYGLIALLSPFALVLARKWMSKGMVKERR